VQAVESQLLATCLDYSPILNMETKNSSETSVYFQRATRRYIPENRDIPNIYFFYENSEVLGTANVKNSVFWDVTPLSLL
jgi:hypothetical protein